MACFKIHTHTQCIFIQMAAIFYYVTFRTIPVVQFCPTFDMLFSGPNSTRKRHKTFSCNFFEVGPKNRIVWPDYVCLSVRKVHCDKTADWIRIPFGMVSGVNRGTSVLDVVIVEEERQGWRRALLKWLREDFLLSCLSSAFLTF